MMGISSVSSPGAAGSCAGSAGPGTTYGFWSAGGLRPFPFPSVPSTIGHIIGAGVGYMPWEVAFLVREE
jgi:hypothetical protein